MTKEALRSGLRRRAGSRLVTALAACAFTAAALPSPDARSAVLSAESAQQASSAPAPEGTLAATPVERAIATGQTQTHRLDLRAGDYVRLVIEQEGIDVGAALVSPRGAVLTASTLRRGGAIHLCAVAGLSGAWRVEVRALDVAPASGRYRIRAIERRVATPADRQRVAAARLLADAEALRARRAGPSLTQAIAGFRRAAAASRAAGDSLGQARALRELGGAYHDAGRPQDAVEPLLESLRLAQLEADADAVCASLSGLARVNLDLGQMEEAERRARAALDAGRAAGLQGRQVEALNALADIALFTGQSSRSLEVLQEAVALAQAIGDRRGEAQARMNQGYAATDLSRVPEAQVSYEAAIARYREVDDASGEASALTGLGILFAVIGENQQALGTFRRAQALLERIGDRLGLARVSTGLGKVQSDLGDPAAALRHYQRALELFRAVKLRNGEAGTLLPLGLCLTRLGRHDEALARYLEALTLIREVGDTRLEGRALEHVGRGYAELGDIDRAIEFQRQASALASRVGDSVGEMYALNSIGLLLNQQGARDQAAATLETALDVARRSKDRFGESLVLYGLARVDSDAKRLDRALSRVRASLELVETLRSTVAGLDLRASYVASVRDRQELEVDLLMDLHAREPAAGYARLAFEASERARARSFMDGLAETRAGIRQDVAPALLARERSVGAAINIRAQHLARLRESGGSAADIDAAVAELEALTADQRDIEAQVRAESPRYAALVAPQPLALADVQRRVLDADSVLLEYFLGRARSYVWAVTTTQVVSHALPARAEIERLVRPFRAQLAEPPPGAAAAEIATPAGSARVADDAGRVLLGPVAASLDRARVLVAPDGILHFVPFAALPDPNAEPSDAASPLIARHEVIHLPSASTLAVLRGEASETRRWAKTAMVFADPVFEADDPRLAPRGVARSSAPAPRPSSAGASEPLGRALRSVGIGGGIPRLLEARQEARAIAALADGVTLALDFGANRTAAMNPALADYRVVHFATHGVANDDNPELSGIVLSLYDDRRRRQDGFLRLHDIYNLTMPVDLVVLSACSTGIGREVVGEGLIGLVRGFMHAGARRVVASLWKVDDQATKELMARFYRGMFRESLTPSAALRAAQLEMQRSPRWRNPFYWAAFVLQGEWN